MKPVSIRYDADTHKQLEESLKKAEVDYDRLVAEGYASVRVVISNHPYSEGVWVEASEVASPLAGEDYVYKSWNKNR
jgi:hypothetical protein